MIVKGCSFILLSLFIFSLVTMPAAATSDKKSHYAKRVEAISERFGKETIMELILRKRNHWITIAVDEQLKDFRGIPSEEFITPGSIMYDLELIGYDLDEIESYLEADLNIKLLRRDIQGKESIIAKLRDEVEELNDQLESYEKTLVSLERKHDETEQQARKDNHNVTAGLFSPTCYDLGFRYGRCVARSFLELECDPEDDFAMPERCKGKHETKKGIQAGTRLILDTSR